MKKAFVAFQFLMIFASTAFAGDGVERANIGACDSEKEPLIVQFIAENIVLDGAVNALLKSGFQKSCAAANSELVAPKKDGSESNFFIVEFRRDLVTYKFTINYSATRVDLPENYAGHYPGSRTDDHSKLLNAKLTGFSVIEDVRAPHSIGF